MRGAGQAARTPAARHGRSEESVDEIDDDADDGVEDAADAVVTAAAPPWSVAEAAVVAMTVVVTRAVAMVVTRASGRIFLICYLSLSLGTDRDHWGLTARRRAVAPDLCPT
ncbi:hypothetical protein NKH77_33435 [Streptomyces sp. M19]